MFYRGPRVRALEAAEKAGDVVDSVDVLDAVYADNWDTHSVESDFDGNSCCVACMTSSLGGLYNEPCAANPAVQAQEE